MRGATVQSQIQPLIGLFGLYTAIGSRMQSYARTPTDSFFFSFYLELHWAAFDSAAGLLPLDLLAMEFADCIDCEKKQESGAWLGKITPLCHKYQRTVERSPRPVLVPLHVL